MIPRANITDWRRNAPWSTDAQAEQDLVISRGLVEIYSDTFLSSALAFRGRRVVGQFISRAAKGCRSTTQRRATSRKARHLLILAGKEYGSGSSRDWAAKGVRLLGVRAVIAESFERIHRSNLVGMGVLPLEFFSGENPKTLGLTGAEVFSIEGIATALAGSRRARVRTVTDDGAEKRFEVAIRIDPPQETEYRRHGGILQYVLR